MNFLDLIAKRRSIRAFGAGPTLDELRAVVRAALMSPTSKGLRCWHFVTVSDPQMLLALSQAKAQGADFLAGAPAAIVVLGDEAKSDAWVEDGSCAAMAMMLQAEDLGLGSCWVQIRARQDASGADAEGNVRRLLGIPQEMRVLAIVALGRKAAERKPQSEERLAWDKVHDGRWE